MKGRLDCLHGAALIRPPLASPRRPSPPRLEACLSSLNPPPLQLTHSPFSFSRPKKTHQQGVVTGTHPSKARSGREHQGLRAPQLQTRSQLWMGWPQ